MSERAETISKRRLAVSTRCENLSGLGEDSGAVEDWPLTLGLCDVGCPFRLGCAGPTWESVSITNDMAGLSFSPALVEAAMAGWTLRPCRAWGMTRLNVGEEAFWDARL